ncbi:phage holin [Tissierella praeacuta]|uniref:phage holin n=1 Tax=Tissierella praeacuta TaxID=43131 RepID=UPI00104A21DB|nr:phage holin [Tissierella praeacuta]TCU72851.1 LL-H family phage holin [Tissierella praeacuta]
MNGEAFVKIGTALIALIGAIITYVIVPFLKSKTTEKQRDTAKFWVQIAVNAAEQIYKEKGKGNLKKEYVLEFLNSKGIKITDEQLDALIEATVYELNKNK